MYSKALKVHSKNLYAANGIGNFFSYYSKGLLVLKKILFFISFIHLNIDCSSLENYERDV